jgi:thiol:disulfide interchange protein
VESTASGLCLIFELKLSPGFHAALNRKYLFLQIDPAVAWGEAEYPPPNSEAFGLPAYQGQVSIRQALGAKAGQALPEELRVSVGWQLCDDSGLCYAPERRSLAVSLGK